MGIDSQGAERMKKQGRDNLKKKFYETTRERWEKEGILKKRSSGSFWGNICCIFFMFLFFFFMIFSKVNEEAISLLGINSRSNFTVDPE